MSYAIKLENGKGGYLRNFSDRVRGHSEVITFSDVGTAEEYAQNHEIKNYIIAGVVEEANPDKRELLT